MPSHERRGAPESPSPVSSDQQAQIRREIGDHIDYLLVTEPDIPGADIADWLTTHYVITRTPPERTQP